MKYSKLVKQKVIDLEGEGLQDGDFGVITKVLRNSAVLEVLCLGDNWITLGDDAFTDALAQNRTLKGLYLNGNRIGAEGAGRLAAALKENQTLQQLALAANDIGDEGVKSIADALVVNKSLQDLGLTGNNIGDEGARRLANSFLVNRSLWSISLVENKIGDNGAKSLATCVLVNQSLREVYLGGNAIGDKGAESWARALKCNRTVEKLRLDRNHITNIVAVDDIEAMLADPNRKVPNNQISPLDQIETFIAGKDDVITKKNDTIVKQLAKIASLEAGRENSLPIVDAVDLASERTNKRSRTTKYAVVECAAMRAQSQNAVRIKQERNAATIALNGVREGKEAVEADLEEARGDLNDANDLVQQQCLAQDIWQRRFDELASKVAGQVDGSVIACIRDRSLARGS